MTYTPEQMRESAEILEQDGEYPASYNKYAAQLRQGADAVEMLTANKWSTDLGGYKNGDKLLAVYRSKPDGRLIRAIVIFTKVRDDAPWWAVHHMVDYVDGNTPIEGPIYVMPIPARPKEMK